MLWYSWLILAVLQWVAIEPIASIAPWRLGDFHSDVPRVPVILFALCVYHSLSVKAPSSGTPNVATILLVWSVSPSHSVLPLVT